MSALDPAFVENFTIVKNLARNRGLDLAEVLDHHGLLRTDARTKEDQMIALTSLRDRLEGIGPETLVVLAGGSFDSLTPAGMLRLAKWWIDQFVHLWEEQ